MSEPKVPSARETELLEAAYDYVLNHGLGDLSLRPLASAIGSSPRVLLYLFGSKEGLVRALLARARVDEQEMLARLCAAHAGADLSTAVLAVWGWLADPARRKLLALWLEAYSRSLTDDAGPWASFAERTVSDWLGLLEQFQEPDLRQAPEGIAQRTLSLAVLRGALLDLLATGDLSRVEGAISEQVRLLDVASHARS